MFIFLLCFPAQHLTKASKIKDSQPFFVRERERERKSRYLPSTQLAMYPIPYVAGRYILYS